MKVYCKDALANFCFMLPFLHNSYCTAVEQDNNATQSYLVVLLDYFGLMLDMYLGYSKLIGTHTPMDIFAAKKRNIARHWICFSGFPLYITFFTRCLLSRLPWRVHCLGDPDCGVGPQRNLQAGSPFHIRYSGMRNHRTTWYSHLLHMNIFIFACHVQDLYLPISPIYKAKIPIWSRPVVWVI